jgi:hypothetical protein
MTTVFLDEVFKPFFFFKSPLFKNFGSEKWYTIYKKTLRLLPSNHWTYGVCECKHAVSNTPKGKNHPLKDRESEGATARLQNGERGARETCFEQRSLTRLQCALWRHLVETIHCHFLFSFGAVLAAKSQTMSGSRRSPCTFQTVMKHISSKDFRKILK